MSGRHGLATLDLFHPAQPPPRFLPSLHDLQGSGKLSYDGSTHTSTARDTEHTHTLCRSSKELNIKKGNGKQNCSSPGAYNKPAADRQTDRYHLSNLGTPSAATQSLGHFPSAGCKRPSHIRTCISPDIFLLSFSLCLMKGSTAT